MLVLNWGQNDLTGTQCYIFNSILTPSGEKIKYIVCVLDSQYCD